MNEMLARLANNRERLYELLGEIGEKEPFIKMLVDISKRSHDLGAQF